MMKKSLLALAVTALSANAFAAVQLDKGTGAYPFASELNVPSTGLVVGYDSTATAAVLQAKVPAGFALAGTSYVRFDLGNGAVFGHAVDASKITSSNASSAFTLAAGGKADDNYVIFSVNTIAAVDTLTLTLDAKVVNENAVPLTYNLYETAANAVGKTGALSTQSANLLTFAPALTVKAKAFDPLDQIDVIGNKSLSFATGYSSSKVKAGLVNLSITEDPTVVLADGSTPATADKILGGYKWTLKGNFSAIADTDGLKGKATLAAFTPAKDKQSASLDVTTVTSPTAADDVIYTVTGQDAIAETSINVVFTPTAASSDYKVDTLTFNNVANLTKNGTTKALNLALKPGGAFSNFVRINNTDSIPGLFFIKVINDAGDSATFPLSAVAGQPDTIAARASTSQMPIADIFAAAEAEGLALTGEGKLRLEITGQTNSLDAQVYTVSTDGTTFSKF